MGARGEGGQVQLFQYLIFSQLPFKGGQFSSLTAFARFKIPSREGEKASAFGVGPSRDITRHSPPITAFIVSLQSHCG